MDRSESIIDLIKNQIKKEDSLPVLSPESLEIQNEATRENMDFSKLTRLVSRDITLTGQILKTANSPFYRGLGDVETLKDAVLRLGQHEMVNIIMQEMHKNNFKSEIPQIRSYQTRLWNHSLSCAMGSLWTVKYLALNDLIPRAFISGLLHDMGQLYLLTAIEKLLISETESFKPPPQLIEKILASLHPSLGYNLLTKWNLPDPYRIIARDHHREDFDVTNMMLVVIRLTDAVCHKMERNDPEENLSGIASSREADILTMSEIGLAELEIALEDAKTRNTPL
ncbi:HDOD domain-containing protein [Desulfospira joergensenii]|uniref:HDOD domain-containing protein n=1 Tax=Desulfospira joergensenii TaxID=53329 RepID=UPI0003B6B85E|nr:HDOD domain-containing protein [Desulfospira joergensenii]